MKLKVFLWLGFVLSVSFYFPPSLPFPVSLLSSSPPSLPPFFSPQQDAAWTSARCHGNRNWRGDSHVTVSPRALIGLTHSRKKRTGGMGKEGGDVTRPPVHRWEGSSVRTPASTHRHNGRLFKVGLSLSGAMRRSRMILLDSTGSALAQLSRAVCSHPWHENAEITHKTYESTHMWQLDLLAHHTSPTVAAIYSTAETRQMHNS